ncbi:hypothetical protein HELRODRAFT_185981 [Helobdella robusta]|uniref:t-SNARE coiled-coil homology domain-containing protein n=1 Tax=Helobdella robusta TaxID=6412 RepID=T1FNI5_HELRO|nr:hypothetical protein HELRODRAFT_185981 [Helobdella robusta]ESN95350.1 hypothetical protein HELRODRAFT_185981 [Helobdella robusta]
MSCRDRTRDFNLAIKTLQPQANGVTSHKNDLPALVSRSAGFMPVAKQVSKDLANTFAKLEKLTMLAQKKSLFDDKPEEIQHLTYVIKQDINSLNEQISKLQQLGKLQMTYNGKNKQSHTTSIVLTLQSHLAKMSSKFKSVLEVRTKNMQNQKMRRDQFSTSSTLTSTLPDASHGGHEKSVLLQDEVNSYQQQQQQNRQYQQQQNNSTDRLSLESEHTSINMEGAGARYRYQQQLQLIEEQESYIQSRADTMVNIEQTIVELGTIFQQLAHMVKEQEEIVHRIDSNVEESSLNIEAAHTELVRYFQSVTSNRWLMLKIFAVLIIFFIIFIIFVA